MPMFVADPTLVRQVALIIGVSLFSLLTGIAIITVGYAWYRARQNRTTESIKAALEPALLDRLYSDGDPAWSSWIAELSAQERDVLESILDSYIRSLRGRDEQSLIDLAVALGIEDRARQQIKAGEYYDRLHSLTWLTLLRRPPDQDVVERYCTDTPRERAAAARALHVGGDQDTARAAVDILLTDATDPFSVFGIDTLYRVTRTNPAYLLELASEHYRSWSLALQGQVLIVVQQFGTAVGSADLSWVVDFTSSPAARVRIEAARALGAYPWRADVRSRVPVDELAADPAPGVRASTYEMLGDWGDAPSMAALAEFAYRESENRPRVAAATGLVENGRLELQDADPALDVAMQWARTNAAFDERARDISSTGSGVSR